MAKHIWEWDRVNRQPTWVLCIKCRRHELLKTVLERIGCQGCPAKGVQEELFKEDRHGRQES
jgi:hypothetical protein